MKVLLPDNVPLDVTAPPGVETVVFDPTQPVPDEHTDAEVLVTWGQSAEQLRAEARRLPRLRWVQTLAAGPDAVLAAGFPVGDDIDAELPHADVLVMLVPALPETERALDARRLALLPEHAWVVNVGRGVTVDEEALVDALRASTIGGAALDVTLVEPLPPDSPLWEAPNLIISPHAAGGRPVGAADLVSANLAAFVAGEPLREVVER